MRILHLATSSDGGAGIAATRIVTAQTIMGMDSMLLTRENQLENVRIKFKKYLGKLVTIGSKQIVNKRYGVISPISISTFNFKEIEIYKPDVLNIHNWYNFLSLRDIYRLSEKYPITFTLHDARLATGGCHVTLGCEKFEQTCKKCPASKIDFAIRQSKKNMDAHLSMMKKYAIVSPSKWMLSELSKSTLVQNSQVSEVIGNPVPFTENISPRAKMATPLRISFVSAVLDSEFKGLELLINSLKFLGANYPEIKGVVKLIGNTVQNHDSKYGGIEVKTIGSVSEPELKSILADTDLLLVPSVSDNFPSVITEAQFAGAIVVATNVGGIPEMIIDGVDGFLSGNTAQEFANNIIRAIGTANLSRMRELARNSAEKRSQSLDIASRYLNVYQKLLAI